MARILGIDYGLQRVGVAISDESNNSAFPRTTLQRTDDQSIIARLQTMCDTDDIGTIVLGLPLDQHGEEGPMAHTVRAFGVALSQATGVHVAYQDERLTSRLSTQLLHGAGRSARQQRGGQTDAIAAQQILQTYLDRCHESA